MLPHLLWSLKSALAAGAVSTVPGETLGSAILTNWFKPLAYLCLQSSSQRGLAQLSHHPNED